MIKIYIAIVLSVLCGCGNWSLTLEGSSKTEGVWGRDEATGGCKIWGFHSSEDSSWSLLGCDGV